MLSQPVDLLVVAYSLFLAVLRSLALAEEVAADLVELLGEVVGGDLVEDEAELLVHGSMDRLDLESDPLGLFVEVLLEVVVVWVPVKEAVVLGVISTILRHEACGVRMTLIHGGST